MTDEMLDLPKIEPCTDLFLTEEDVFVTVAGFEDRRVAACRLMRSGSRPHVFVIRYLPQDDRNDEQSILKELSEKGIAVSKGVYLSYDRFDPHSFPEEFASRFRETGAKTIILDASVMSKLLLLLCLDVCRELGCGVSVMYAEAKHYGPSLEAFEKAKQDLEKYRPSIQVYAGVHGLLRHARFSSVAMQGQPTAAIAFMSFNEQLTQALINEVSPSRLFLINGRPPSLLWRENATAWIHERLRKEWRESDNPVGDSGLPLRATSTLWYAETVNLLLDLYWKLSIDHRILIAPTGSKMQTLGVFIVKRLHPDIHIEYPTPVGFLDAYSQEIGQAWKVEFGCLSKALAGWKQLERRRRLLIPR
jgi:hypothetical protein